MSFCAHKALCTVVERSRRCVLQTLCVMNNYATCRSGEHFERPDDFLPERWLRDQQCDGKLKHHAFASLPFGFGTRSCIGTSCRRRRWRRDSPTYSPTHRSLVLYCLC